MQQTCKPRTEIDAYLCQMQPLVDLWSHIDRQVVSELTAMPLRLMMGVHVEHLQSLYRGALRLDVPLQCSRAHAAFLAAVGATINAYLATAEVRSDDHAHATLLGAIKSYHTWRSEVARLQPVEYSS